MKIVSSGKGLNSPEFYRKKKVKKRLKFILVLTFLILLVSSFIYLSRLENLLITNVVVTDKDSLDKDNIIDSTTKILQGFYFGVIPKTNALIYPRSAIKQALLNEFPRLESVDLNVTDFNTLNVTLQERESFALYCASALNPSVTSDCYFLDKNGFIFALAPSFTGTVYFVFSTLVPMENPLGQEFVGKDEFHSLLKFIDSLLAFNIHPVALGLGDNEYSLALPTNGQIIWKKNSNFDLVYANLEAFLTDETIKADSDFLDKILYLDLRADNKIRWKFKEE